MTQGHLTAGFSATLAIVLLGLVVAEALFVWGRRRDYWRWRSLSIFDRADLAIMLGGVGFFAFATYNRAVATVGWARDIWNAGFGPTGGVLFVLPFAIVFVSLKLWGVSIHAFGTDRGIVYWQRTLLIAVIFGTFLSLK